MLRQSRVSGAHIAGRRKQPVRIVQSGQTTRALAQAADAQNEQFSAKDFAIWGGIPIIVVLILRLFMFGVYEIPSGSMMDTLQIGDQVITTRLVPGIGGGVKRGDVIVFKDPANWLQGVETSAGPFTFDNGEYLIKRVIGLPGDVVACKGSGQPITINGVPIDDSSIRKPGVNPSDIAFSITVTDGNLFVMGDNRSNSADSRLHQDDGNNGLVPIRDVEGVALAVYWPVTQWASLARPSGMFDGVGGITEVR